MNVEFTVPGVVPSKSNFRRGGPDWRRKWAKIKGYEREVGWAATVAGAKKLYGKPVAVHLVLINQKCDLDNALKCPIDGLKHVAYPDDRQEWVHELSVRFENAPLLGPMVAYRLQPLA